jgi:hypothetical protein
MSDMNKEIVVVEPATGAVFNRAYCREMFRLPFTYGWDHYRIRDIETGTLLPGRAETFLQACNLLRQEGNFQMAA